MTGSTNEEHVDVLRDIRDGFIESIDEADIATLDAAITALEALEYVFGSYTDWERVVEERLTPPWPLEHHAKAMGLFKDKAGDNMEAGAGHVQGSEWVPVRRSDLIEWAQDWQVDHGTGDGDIVTPFDTYLLKAPAEAQAVAWMTHHDEPMLFPTRTEAAAYCDPSERPIPLFTAPPRPEASAPVGVEGLAADLETIWNSVSDDKETNAAYQRLKAALAQKPEAVDDAMVARAVAGYETGPWASFSPEESREAHRERMRAALQAALAAQQGGES